MSWVCRLPSQRSSAASRWLTRPIGTRCHNAGRRPNSRFELAKPCGKVRHLNGPYLVGAMTMGAVASDKRPPTSVRTFQLQSERQKEILVHGTAMLQKRMTDAAQFTADRSRFVRPVSASPSPYLTTMAASYKPRPQADSQQHRLRKQVTSGLVNGAGGSLESAPIHVPIEPLEGGGALHATRYLGVRDPDGSRRMLEMDTTGGPVLTLRAPYERPMTAPAVPYVPSQPRSRNMDEEVNFEVGTMIAAAASPPLPRQPWTLGPPSAPIMEHMRKSFAGDFTSESPLGEPVMREYKIQSTIVHHAAAKAAWDAQMPPARMA